MTSPNDPNPRVDFNADDGGKKDLPPIEGLPPFEKVAPFDNAKSLEKLKDAFKLVAGIDKLTKRIDNMELRLAESNAVNERLSQGVKCGWCGDTVTFKDALMGPFAMRAHMSKCDKSPVGQLDRALTRSPLACAPIRQEDE